MNNKILVVGFACLSVVAAAQSNEKKEQPSSSSTVVSPRDAASGQASGKRMHKPMTIQKEYDAAGREASTGKATGKTMAQDDWQATSVSSAPESKPKSTRVAAGDLNGDGKADVAATQNGQAQGQNAANSRSDVKSPRDLATGQASGKRQHQDLTVTKSSDKAAAPKK